MKNKYYKIGVVYGHCGSGNGIPICVAVLANDIIDALKRAREVGGIKKSFKNFWYAKEIDEFEYMITRSRWQDFKNRRSSSKTSFA